jgi:hypothetical protein
MAKERSAPLLEGVTRDNSPSVREAQVSSLMLETEIAMFVASSPESGEGVHSLAVGFLERCRYGR